MLDGVPEPTIRIGSESLGKGLGNAPFDRSLSTQTVIGYIDLDTSYWCSESTESSRFVTYRSPDLT